MTSFDSQSDSVSQEEPKTVRSSTSPANSSSLGNDLSSKPFKETVPEELGGDSIDERTALFSEFLQSLPKEKQANGKSQKEQKPEQNPPEVPDSRELPTVVNPVQVNAEELTVDLNAPQIVEQTVVYETEREKTPGVSGSTGEGGLLRGVPKVPPTQIAGYEFEKFLGHGAYGEVWTAIQVSTLRRVAVKFYTHHGQDLSSLTKEVEKLSLLFSDQNVVQLLEVGWDAEVPYYIMEYLENGSLAEAISGKKLTPEGSGEIFGTLLEAMLRAHQKGIIHCDLKPGNILMDQNGKPRVADFGQSRLSSEMAPALGTLFYMPPEQTQSTAHPDVRWDVYALGAIFYTMLMGRPPHYSPFSVEKLQENRNLPARLNAYRKLIYERPVPVDTRQLRGMTLPTAQIIEKCLQPDPKNRFQSIEELLKAWKLCQKRRATFPMYILGAVMPVLIVLCAILGGNWEMQCTLEKAQDVLTRSSVDSSHFAAEAVARNVEAGIMRRFRVVSQLAENWQFRELTQNLSEDPEWLEISRKLGDDSISETEREALRKNFVAFPKRMEVQALLKKLLPKEFNLGEDFLYFCDLNGIYTAQIPASSDVGLDFMPYVTDDSTLQTKDSPVKDPVISDVYQDHLTGQWAIAISVPLHSAEENPKFLGFIFVAVNVCQLVNMVESRDRFVTLVDQRPGKSEGLILEHPLYHQLTRNGMPLPDELLAPKYRLTKDRIPDSVEKGLNYSDPLSKAPQAVGQFAERWLASTADVNLEIGTGGHWTVITQKSYSRTIGSTFWNLEHHFWHVVLVTAFVFLLAVEILWYVVYRRFILERKPR